MGGGGLRGWASCSTGSLVVYCLYLGCDIASKVGDLGYSTGAGLAALLAH